MPSPAATPEGMSHEDDARLRGVTLPGAKSLVPRGAPS